MTNQPIKLVIKTSKTMHEGRCSNFLVDRFTLYAVDENGTEILIDSSQKHHEIINLRSSICRAIKSLFKVEILLEKQEEERQNEPKRY